MIGRERMRYVVLAAFSLLYFLLNAATFNSLGLVLPFMVPDLGMSWAQAGLGFTLLGVACGLCSLAPAALIRAVGVSATLAIGTAILMGGFVCLALASDPLAYQGGTILLGIGFCFCATVPAVHIISGTFSRRSSALGTYFTIGSLGSVAGPVFFYVVNEASGGWRSYWMMCAAAALAIGGATALSTRARAVSDTAAPEADAAPLPGWTLREAIATPQLWMVIAAYTGCLLVNTTVHSFAFQHLMEHGQSKASATALVSLAALIGAGGSAMAGVLGEKVDGRWLTVLSLGMLSLTGASLAVAQNGLTLTTFAVSLGVGLGFSYVGTAMLLHDYFGRRASLELYSLMTVISTSAALGPLIGGIVRDRTQSFAGVFGGIAAIDALMLLGVLLMRRPTLRAASGGEPMPVAG